MKREKIEERIERREERRKNREERRMKNDAARREVGMIEETGENRKRKVRIERKERRENTEMRWVK